jgi:hypothetical protein
MIAESSPGIMRRAKGREPSGLDSLDSWMIGRIKVEEVLPDHAETPVVRRVWLRSTSYGLTVWLSSPR